MSFHAPNQYRVRNGRLGTPDSMGNCGLFRIPAGRKGVTLRVIAHDGLDLPEGYDGFAWEHVSASYPDRCPTWAEMCIVKDLFWDAEDAVMQLHPPRSTWVNCHPFCLHLWRPLGVAVPLPPPVMVGYQPATA